MNFPVLNLLNFVINHGALWELRLHIFARRSQTLLTLSFCIREEQWSYEIAGVRRIGVMNCSFDLVLYKEGENDLAQLLRNHETTKLLYPLNFNKHFHH